MMLFLFQLLAIHPSHAILGAYIPESEHIAQACKISAEKVLHQRRDIDPDTGKQTGVWTTEKEESDYFFCSGTLIGKNEVASASHCSQLIINKTAAHYDSEVITVSPDDKRVQHLLTKISLQDAISKGILQKIEGSKDLKLAITIARRSIMPGKIYATCGISTGRPETQELKWENSWPHPRVRKDDPAMATIDSGIYRTSEPFSFDPMPTAKTYAETIALLRNTSSCRAFGFGIDNKKNSGTLHGVRIYQYNNVSEYIISSRTHFNGTMFGDSGGTLTCKNPKGNDILVGSIQGGRPIDPNAWMGSRQDFIFTPMSYGPVRRWHEFVRALPLESMHCGEDACDKGHPILNEYVSTFDAINELNGLTDDLKHIIDVYSPHYSKSYFAGYKTLFKQVTAAHQDILSEYNDWKNHSPVISGRTLYIKQRIINGQPSDLKDVILGDPFQYRYNQFPASNFPAYTRMRAFMLMQYLQEELFAIKHQGLSLSKTGREILDHAKEHYWEYLEKEILKYNDQFKN